MDLLTALKILIRRYPVVLTGLVLTLLGVFQVGKMIEPTYEAKSTVLLLSPGSSTTNPFNEFGANLEVTADAIMVVLQSPVGGEKLEAAGATGGFKLERIQGPLIDITASAPTESAATRTVELVVAGLREELETRQAASPAEQHITVSELTQPVAKPKLGSRIRAQAAVLAVGLTGTVAAGLAADAIMRQRREANARRQEADEDEWEPPVRPGTGRSGAGLAGARPGTGAGGPAGVYRPASPRPGSVTAASGGLQPVAKPTPTVNGAPPKISPVVSRPATGAANGGPAVRTSVYPARSATPVSSAGPTPSGPAPSGPADDGPRHPAKAKAPAGEGTDPGSNGNGQHVDEDPDSPRSTWR